MKKTAITILLALSTSGLFAQTAYDALMLSENSYEGTARSAAMGNAFTALGGDLGAVTINPAGSAMASYSQITVTPGITISSTTAEGVSPYENGDLPYFQRKMKSSLPKGSLPNIGASINFNTGRNYGLVNWSLGFIVNKTADYNQDVYANGRNSTTSFIGQMAYEASRLGFYPDELGGENAYDSGINWKYVTGFKSAMFDPFNDIYVAATEMVYDDNTCFVAGELDQTYGRRTRGDKYEYIINAGFNISDFVYFGMNLGINSISYSYDEYFKEEAVNSEDFLVEYKDDQGNIISSSYFNRMKYRSGYSFSGTGCFAKFGVIVNPFKGFRVGAAFQTPTRMNISESWEDEGQTDFTGRDGKSWSSLSPIGENNWIFTSPLKANFGVAYTIGQLGTVSADYELSNYGNLKYRSSLYTDRSTLEAINEDMKESYGTAHSLRAGVEFKPIPSVAVRAGYNMNTSAQKAIWDNYYEEYVKVRRDITHKASFGIGFSSKGSFFADAALTRTFIPREYFMPYADYVFTADANGEYIVDPNYYAPEILIRSALWKVVLTLGFRF
jgi:hypothetical protein